MNYRSDFDKWMSQFICLHYSPDDNGFYFQDYTRDHKVSILYHNKASALNAYYEDQIIWED